MKLSVLFTLFLTSFITIIEAISASKVSKLRTKLKKSVIQLKNSNFEELLNGPRDFHMLVLLTATSSQIGCVLCSQFDPDYQTAADAWLKQHQQHNDGGNDDGKLFFARADFTDGQRKIFEKFQLQSVPKLYLFKPTDVADASSITQFEEFQFIDGDNLDFLTQFIKEQTGNDLKVERPVRYDNLIFSVVVLALLAVLVVRFQDVFFKVITSKQLWGGAMLLSILLFISGYMFNNIRATQYIGMGPSGAPEYFMAGQQNQFAIETNILSTTYGLLGVFMVALISKVPEIKHPKVHAIVVFLLAFSLLVGYSVLFDIFAKKSYGYPFRLLKLFNF